MGCIGIGAIVVLLTLLALGFWTISPPLPLRSFDSNEWRAVVRSDDYARQDMVGSLIWQEILDGKTESEVLQILGPDCECAYFKEWDLVYWLGPDRSWMSLDSEWLVIRFDKAGGVSEYTLVTD